jgi:hypothetical protein
MNSEIVDGGLLIAIPMVTHRLGTVQLERPTGDGTEDFSLFLHMRLSKQPQNKLQAIMDTFLQTLLTLRGQSQEGNALHLVWC